MRPKNSGNAVERAVCGAAAVTARVVIVSVHANWVNIQNLLTLCTRGGR
jgi:hypothetical protein